MFIATRNDDNELRWKKEKYLNQYLNEIKVVRISNPSLNISTNSLLGEIINNEYQKMYWFFIFMQGFESNSTTTNGFH